MPDGRNVTTLINVTPIRLADGAVETVVVIVKPFSPTELVVRIRAALRREAGPECCRDASLPVADGASFAVQTPSRPHPRWALDTAGRFVQHRPPTEYRRHAVSRTELSARIAARSSLSRADAATAVDAVVSAIADALASGEDIAIAYVIGTVHRGGARR